MPEGSIKDPQFASLQPRDSPMIIPLIKRSVPPSDDEIRLSGEQALISEHLVGDLHIFYVFDLPSLFWFVSQGERESLGLNASDLRTLSVRNLVKRRGRPEIRQSDTGAMLILDGDLEASLLLVDHLWAQLAPQLPGDLIAAVPSRDVLAVSGTGVTGGVALLRRAVERVWADPSTNPKLLLTRSLLVRQEDSWQLFEC
jgi:uncharacterized protein YtpQ (UPF0354 family)